MKIGDTVLVDTRDNATGQPIQLQATILNRVSSSSSMFEVEVTSPIEHIGVRGVVNETDCRPNALKANSSDYFYKVKYNDLPQVKPTNPCQCGAAHCKDARHARYCTLYA